jgi:asparagine synthase (glutamine-hydrolysing)
VANDLLKDEKKEEIQKTFSACSDVKRFDEREYIDEVVKNRQIDSYYTFPSTDHLFEVLDDIIWHQDEPFGSTSIFAQWLVFDLAAQNRVKVMLDGQGADEQLAGYHNFFHYRFAELFRCGRWISLLREMIAVKKYFGYDYIRSFKGTVGYALFIPMKNIFPNRVRENPRKPTWMNKEIFDAVPVRHSFDTLPIPLVPGYSYLQLMFTSLPLLLHWEDRDSMAHSVESRVPFLDHRLVEFVFSLPTDFKIRNGCTKVVLRESMRGILPDKIRKRMDKLGFVTAEEEWIRSQKTELFRQLVKEAITQSRGLLTEKTLDRLEDIISGKEPYDFVVWRWVCFGRWMKKFEVSS